MGPWGWLTTVDVSGIPEDLIENEDVCRAFIVETLDRLGMVPIGPAHVQFCETNDPQKVGVSGYQLLQDSNISFHLCTKTREGYFDIFSCKPYEQAQVIEAVRKYFKPAAFHSRFIDRQAPSV